MRRRLLGVLATFAVVLALVIPVQASHKPSHGGGPPTTTTTTTVPTTTTTQPTTTTTLPPEMTLDFEAMGRWVWLPTDDNARCHLGVCVQSAATTGRATGQTIELFMEDPQGLLCEVSVTDPAGYQQIFGSLTEPCVMALPLDPGPEFPDGPMLIDGQWWPYAGCGIANPTYWPTSWELGGIFSYSRDLSTNSYTGSSPEPCTGWVPNINSSHVGWDPHGRVVIFNFYYGTPGSGGINISNVQYIGMERQPRQAADDDLFSLPGWDSDPVVYVDDSLPVATGFAMEQGVCGVNRSLTRIASLRSYINGGPLPMPPDVTRDDVPAGEIWITMGAIDGEGGAHGVTHFDTLGSNANNLIVIDSAEPWDTSVSTVGPCGDGMTIATGELDLQGTVTHELGHTLGLNDVCDTTGPSCPSGFTYIPEAACTGPSSPYFTMCYADPSDGDDKASRRTFAPEEEAALIPYYGNP